MIDLNDPQIDKYNKPVSLLSNQTFKDLIETGKCEGLK